MTTAADALEVMAIVAACHYRTAPRMDDDEATMATAQVWAELFDDRGFTREELIEAVKVRARSQAGAPEPADVLEVARGLRRDRLEREPDSAREARQAALAVKVADQVEELAGRRGVPAAQQVAVRPSLNPLCVKCPWCRAGVGQHCIIPGTRLQLRSGPHPSRRDLAKGVSA